MTRKKVLLHLNRLRHRLTDPAAALHDPQDRQRAGLLAFISLFLLLFASIVEPLWMLANPDFGEAVYITIVIIGLFAVIYGLSRTRYYLFGTYILVYMMPVLLVVNVMVAPGEITERLLNLNFLVAPVLLASILLGVWGTLTTSALCIATTAALLYFYNIPVYLAYSYIVYICAMAALILIISSVQGYYVRRLRESEKRYRGLFEQSTDAVFIISDDWQRYVQVNQRALDMLGYTAEEMRHISLPDTIAPDEHQSSELLYKRLVAGEQIPLYTRMFRKKDGTLFPAEVNIEVVRDDSGDPLHFQSVVRDITRREEAQAALREREMFLRSVVQNALFGVHFYRLDERERLIFEGANPAADSILNITHQFLIGKPVDEVFRGFLQGELPFIYHQIIQHGDTYHDDELAYEMNGQTVIFEIQVFRTLPRHIAIFFSDVTERHEAQEQALRLAIEQERIAVMTQFVEHASHELRTPLTVMTLNLHMIRRIDDAERRERLVDDANRQISLLTDLLDTILLMTQLDSGKSFHFEPGDLNALAHRVITRFELIAQHKKLSIHFQPDRTLPPLLMDALWLEEAIRRIYDNAIRFTPDGGSVTVRTGLDGANAYVEVLDTGIGIAAQALVHIFERFWRVDKAHSTPGFGLGLPMAQKIVEQHAGQISVESEPGAGSTFRITLPIGQMSLPQR